MNSMFLKKKTVVHKWQIVEGRQNCRTEEESINCHQEQNKIPQQESHQPPSPIYGMDKSTNRAIRIHTWQLCEQLHQPCSSEPSINSNRKAGNIIHRQTQKGQPSNRNDCLAWKKKGKPIKRFTHGLSDKTWTCGLYHPKVARYQLRHTQIALLSTRTL